MSLPNKFGITWSNFNQNLASYIKYLRKDQDFSDVTLASEDGHQFSAHKFILAACSPVFTDLLKDSKHSQPIICLQEVKSEVLGWILDFVYHGEVNISQESLSQFISSAGQLELKGVAGLSRKEQEYINSVSTPTTLIETPTEETGNEVKPKMKQEYIDETVSQKKKEKIRERIEVSKYLDFEGELKT